MKILSGRLKDRTIPFKAQPGLRPTPDRVRKAMVDAMAAVLPDADILDLFSGTGALGVEAVSGGAASVVFVESDRRRAADIGRLLRALKLEDFCRVESGDVFDILPRLADRGERYHAVVADPPYEKGLAERTLDFFQSGACLHPGACLAIETYKKEPLPKTIGRLTLHRTAAYGDTCVHYYLLRQL